jgi:PQQ-dependent catabolism-associated CXXCW motif protein
MECRIICHSLKFAKALVPYRINNYSRRMPALSPNSPRNPQARVLTLAGRALVCVMLSLTSLAHAQQSAGSNGYADEDRDWGVAPTQRLRLQPYHAPTPLSIPGAQVLRTRELQAMLAGASAPILIDVLSEAGHVTLAGAVWMSGAGRGTNFMDPVQSVLAQLLAKLSGGDKARAMVFVCANSQCWLSYNAALRAVAAGYEKVYWYRGGIEAWTAAGLPTAKTAGQPAVR